MTFVTKSWQNAPSTATPLTAAALIDLETRLSAYVDSIGRGTQTLAPGATVTPNAALGNYCFLTYASAFTIAAPLNPTPGQFLTFKLTHDATATVYAITWNAVFKRAGGAFANTNTANAVDQIQFGYDGTAWNEISRAINLS